MKYKVYWKDPKAIVGWLCVIVFSIAVAGSLAIGIFDPETSFSFGLILGACFIVFVALGVLQIYVARRPMIIVDGHKLVIRNAFKRKTELKISDITSRQTVFCAAPDTTATAAAGGGILGGLFVMLLFSGRNKPKDRIEYIYYSGDRVILRIHSQMINAISLDYMVFRHLKMYGFQTDRREPESISRPVVASVQKFSNESEAETYLKKHLKQSAYIVIITILFAVAAVATGLLGFAFASGKTAEDYRYWCYLCVLFFYIFASIPQPRRFLNRIKKSNSLIQAANELYGAIELDASKNSKLIPTANYVYCKNRFYVPYSDIIWAYVKKIDASNFHIVLQIKSSGLKKIEELMVPLSEEHRNANDIICAIREQNPQALIGFTAENRKRFLEYKTKK